MLSGSASVMSSHCCVSDEKVIYLTPEQEKDKSHFIDKEVCVCLCQRLSALRKQTVILPLLLSFLFIFRFSAFTF